jgi:hypothetical protein
MMLNWSLKTRRHKRSVCFAAGAAAALAGWGIASPSRAAVILGQYPFTSNASATVGSAAGVSFGAVAAGGGVVSPGVSGGRFNGDTWEQTNLSGAVTVSDYVGFTVTPVAGYRVALTQLAFDHQKTQNNGPGSLAVLSTNGGLTAVGTQLGTDTVTTGNKNKVVPLSFNAATAGETFRVFAWGGQNNTNRGFSVDNIVVSGDTQALASLQATVGSAAPAQVIVGATNIRHAIDVTNDALAAGSLATQGLDYSLALSSPNGFSLASPSSGTGLGGNVSSTHFVDVDTSAAATRSGSLTASSANAWRANGTAGAGSAPVTLANVDVLDHANGSFATPTDTDTIVLDFGTVAQNSAQSLPFSIHNLVATAALTAGLDLDSFFETDPDGVFSTNLATFANLAAGGSSAYSVALDTTNLGTFGGSYILSLSDQDLAGATGGQLLTINVIGEVVPEPTSLGLIGAAAVMGLARRRRRQSA